MLKVIQLIFAMKFLTNDYINLLIIQVEYKIKYVKVNDLEIINIIITLFDLFMLYIKYTFSSFIFAF